MTRFALAVIFGLGLSQAACVSNTSPETRSFELHAIEVNGTKYWQPSTLTVRQGDTVKLKLISKVPGANSVHGFAIDAFSVQEVADTQGKEVSFVASKAGIFPIRCHLHPAHIGGQLVVLQ